MQQNETLTDQSYCLHGKYNNLTEQVDLALLICLETQEIHPRYTIFASCMYLNLFHFVVEFDWIINDKLSQLFISIRYVNFSAIYYRHITGLRICTKITKFTRQMSDLLFNWSGNWLHLNGLHTIQWQRLYSTKYMSTDRIHHAFLIFVCLLLVECVEFWFLAEFSVRKFHWNWQSDSQNLNFIYFK